MRKPIVAGSFYPASFSELDKSIKEAFEGKFGPAALPGKPRNKKIGARGVIVPHAGYAYSAGCAAWAYKEIAENCKAEIFILVGTNHSYGKAFSFTLEDFETPFGIAKNKKNFSLHLIEKAKKILDASRDEEAHAREHSIEIQLPFLQFLYGKNLRIVPILVSSYNSEECKKMASIIVKVAKQLDKKICVVASSDFTHYGLAYNFMPFTTDIKKNLYKLDEGAIKLIEKMQTKKFLLYAKKITICGAGSIAVAIEICKILGSKEGELLRYYTSGDVVGDYNSAVGYASIIFK